MSELIAVHVTNKFLWEAVREHLLVGDIDCRMPPWDNRATMRGDENDCCVAVNEEGGHYRYFNPRESCLRDEIKVITVDEYFKRFSKPPEPSIMIGGHRVEHFTSNGFNVGCLFVSWEIYDKIGERRKA